MRRNREVKNMGAFEKASRSGNAKSFAAYRTGRNGKGYFVRCFVSDVPDEASAVDIERLLAGYGMQMKEVDDYGKSRSSYTISPVELTPPEVRQEKQAETISFGKLRKGGRVTFLVRTTVRLGEAIDRHVKKIGVSRNAWFENLAIQELSRNATDSQPEDSKPKLKTRRS